MEEYPWPLLQLDHIHSTRGALCISSLIPRAAARTQPTRNSIASPSADVRRAGALKDIILSLYERFQLPGLQACSRHLTKILTRVKQHLALDVLLPRGKFFGVEFEMISILLCILHNSIPNHICKPHAIIPSIESTTSARPKGLTRNKLIPSIDRVFFVLLPQHLRVGLWCAR